MNSISNELFKQTVHDCARALARKREYDNETKSIVEENELITSKLAEIRETLFDESDEIYDGHDMTPVYVAYPYDVLLGIERKIIRQQNELNDWRDLYRMWLKDSKLQEHWQTYEWEKKAKEMGLNI